MSRRILYTFLLPLVVGLMSCNKGGSEEKPDTYFEVSPAEILVDGDGGQEFVSVHSSEDWLVRSGASWAKAVNSTGKASADPVKVSLTFEANPSAESRSAVITFKTIGGKSKEVNVTQKDGGEPSGPKGIGSAEDLIAFAIAVNSGTSLSRFMQNGVVVLTADIDVSSIKEWIPAGSKENPYMGAFDGRNHSIVNVGWSIDADSYPDAALIGYSKGANIRNLTFGKAGDNVILRGSSSKVNAAGIVGYSDGGSISGCVNNANITGQLSAEGENVCLAGICAFYHENGGTGVEQCKNIGNVISKGVCRAAAFVAYNEGHVTGCVNTGCIIANRNGEIGPAWGCSYNKIPGFFTSCTGTGHVGDYDTYKSSPENAPSDAYKNAVASPASNGYKLEEVKVDWTRDSYYDWTVTESFEPCNGVSYSKCEFVNVPRKMNVLEVDLKNPNIEITTSFADDIVPNPNGNGNSNNGFNLRETLSQLCARKRAEGMNIIAGVNSGFFDSNDGIPRGFHIEDGQAVYINNPSVVNRLPNHSWAFTVFKDGTASCGKKTFSGKIKVADKEYDYYSVNDTVMRHTNSSYQINLYDHHYREIPHTEKKTLVNQLAKNALYIVAEYTGEPMKVNCGYAQARIISIQDGRSSTLEKAPYITSPKQIGIALSGAKSDAVKNSVSVGDVISFRCDISVESEASKPILTQNSTMFRIMQDGKDNTSSIPSDNQSITTYDPLTFPVVSEDKSKLWIVEVDGRQDWVSLGVKAYEMYRIGLKLGGYNMTRFDGGGSSVMWVYNPAHSKGSVVNQVSDSKGERSCMNYLLIKAK